MAIRMSQMLRASRDVRRQEPRGAAAPAVEPDPVPETTLVAPELPAQAPPALAAADLANYGIDPESAVDLEEPATGPRVEEEVYSRLVEVAQASFDAATTGTIPREAEIIPALRDARNLLAENDRLLSETVRQRSGSMTWGRRAANTSVLAVRLGMDVGYDERRCLALGLCGLMHDLGMLRVPQASLDSPKLSPEQLQQLRQHPIESQRIIAGFGDAFAWIGKIVVQVHERFDGSGYPHGLRKAEIHEMARILGLVDTYEAMAHPRADRRARVTYHALKEIIDLRNTLFERRLIKALIHIVSIFPLGSLVKLNSGEIGRVIGTSRTHPTRPMIEIAVDARGNMLDVPREMSLEDEPMLYIVDPAIEEGVIASGGGDGAR
jgi:HD-GYP domain-containing protein (c-di-GMP phosphodiesterase class II)